MFRLKLVTGATEAFFRRLPEYCPQHCGGERAIAVPPQMLCEALWTLYYALWVFVRSCTVFAISVEGIV